MGITDISDAELEDYTRDFSKLIQEHLHEASSSSLSTLDTPTPSDLSTPSDYARVGSLRSSPGSAVYKTFPSDSRVQLMSASPSPLHRSPTPPLSPHRPHHLKRKVVRKCNNGESRVFDESVSEFGSELGSGSGAVLTRPLSDLSISSEATSSGGGSAGVVQPPTSSRHRQQPASFIRPPSSHPHTRGLKKCDPVNRYHEFRELWERSKAPGEKNRGALRWHIREQLLRQDVPLYEPQRRVVKQNSFVVPTDKKRLALRWEVRHQLAQQ